MFLCFNIKLTFYSNSDILLISRNLRLIDCFIVVSGEMTHLLCKCLLFHDYISKELLLIFILVLFHHLSFISLSFDVMIQCF